MNRARPIVVTVTALLLLSACSTKGSSDAPSGGGGTEVKTDRGVSGSEITLGVMTDKSGPFKNLGLGVTQGNELWAADVNAAGGVCGRQVKLETVDSGYKADTAKTLYPQLEGKILGFLQLLGSPINAALKQNLQTDKVTALALSWSSEILNNPYEVIPGTTYDVEMINGLSYLQEQNLLKDGDTVGHIYIDGEYGGNGLRGAKYFAERHRLNLIPAKVTSSDTDMANIVTGFRGQGVKAILVTGTPAQTLSAAGTNQALGLNVPLLGNNPVFDPALLKSPAAGSLSKLYVVASSVPFSADTAKAKEIAGKYKAKYTEPPNVGIPYGYANGEIWQQILKKACDNKDMTRDGIQAALKQSTKITTDNLVADLDFSQAGAPATRQVYVAQVDAGTEGGLRQVKALFASPEALSYKAPHQK